MLPFYRGEKKLDDVTFTLFGSDSLSGCAVVEVYANIHDLLSLVLLL